MKILFTGASSFSGLWFVKELASRRHTITAVFKRPLEDYDGIRRHRIDLVLPFCNAIFNAPFGHENFMQALNEDHWDLFCHHAADVTDYRSPNFNVAAALASNTYNLKAILQQLCDRGCRKVLLTGSVFEQNEGTGSDELRAVSPYGLSKGLTYDVFAYYTSIMKMKLGKFVIPNPFGPFEEGRFTNYLAANWLEGKVPAVNSPLYIRDNVPVNLLAKAYVQFAEELEDLPGIEKFYPSYYAESQGEFTARFAHALKPRLNVDCRFDLKEQKDFSEPIERVNYHCLDVKSLKWNEDEFWDETARYYQSLMTQAQR